MWVSGRDPTGGNEDGIHLPYLAWAFFGLPGVRGGGGGRNLPGVNISKTIGGMPMKFSQVDGMVKLI